MREVTAQKTGTVEKWTFQLITPRGRLSLIAPARRPVMKRREEEEIRRGTRRQESPRAIYQFHEDEGTF